MKPISERRIIRINEVLCDYYSKHPRENKRPAKDFMELFVSEGIFSQDSNERPGLPLRKLLREMDEENACDRIPYLIVERKKDNRFWYFAPIASTATTEK